MSRESTISRRRGRFKGWDCCLLTMGPLELALVPQVGGRIMGCAFGGHQLFFTQPEREGQVEDPDSWGDVGARKRGMEMPLWGGDKTWLAPQSRWNDAAPFLDLDSGPFDLRMREATPRRVAVEMTSRVCRESGIEITRSVILSRGVPGFTVRHRLTNHSGRTAEWGIWSVGMLLRPGRVYLPRSPSSRHPEGVKTFAEEGESGSARDAVVTGMDDLAVIDCTGSRKFKYGVDGGEGWLLGVLETRGGLVGYLKRVPAGPRAVYAHGCVGEVFNSSLYPYLEMEAHGPLVRMRPGESSELEERHAVFEVPRWPRDAAEARARVESFTGA